jgi:NAD(P)-dependent dehydrogenase (short-subunit alcohol dehydrogenase family)
MAAGDHGRVIITGASSGLGLATAEALAAIGLTVVLAVRNADRGTAAARRIRERVPEARLEIADLDLARLSSVNTFVQDQLQRGPIRALINNAGISMVPRRTFTEDGFELQQATNFLGHFALTAQLLPGLRQSPDARVVSVTSLTAWAPRHVDLDFCATGRYRSSTAYAQSKLACAIFALELDRRLKIQGRPVASILTHPGWAATGLFSHHASVTNRSLHRLAARFAATAQAGAASQIHAAIAPGLRGGEFIGPRWLAQGVPHPIRPRRMMSEPAVGRAVWAAAEQATGVSSVELP